MLKVDESVKQSRRWVDQYIETLDPETEYVQIMSTVAQYQLDEFVLHFLITRLNAHIVMPAHGAEAQVFTNKSIRRPVKRMQDTLGFFWTWYAYGPDAPETIESVNQLNQIHMNVAKQVPGHFEKNSDFMITFCMIAVGQHRLLKKLGLGGLPPHLQKAQYNYLKDLSKHFRREGDQEIVDFPDSFEGMEAYAEDWESWDHEYSPVQTDLINALVYGFTVRWFPRPLHWLGRWITLYSMDDVVLKHYRIKPIRGVRRFVAHWILKTIFTYKMKYAADPKVSAVERRELLSREQLLKEDGKAASLADKLGWHRGGKSAVGIRLKSTDNSISMCPVMHEKKLKT